MEVIKLQLLSVTIFGFIALFLIKAFNIEPLLFFSISSFVVITAFLPVVIGTKIVAADAYIKAENIEDFLEKLEFITEDDE